MRKTLLAQLDLLLKRCRLTLLGVPIANAFLT